MNRVVITGIGTFCPLAKNNQEYWQALADSRSAIGSFEESLSSQLKFKFAAQFRDYQAELHFSKRECESLDPFSQYLSIAAREAIHHSGLDVTDESGREMALITASAAGGQVTIDQEARRLYQDQRGRLRPLTIPRFMLNAGLSQLASEFPITGPSFTVSTACASASHAIGQAFQMVRSGLVKSALVGASEAPFCLGYLKAWEALRVVDPNICRPFAADRAGINLGEGACCFVLETIDQATKRGAKIQAELLGFGMTTEHGQLTKISSKGAKRAMDAALSDARINSSQIDYINAHGTGTEMNDRCESTAIREVLGPKASEVLVSSTKSMIGHCLGASGALELSATVLSLSRGVVAPTLNLGNPCPDCNLDFVPLCAREAKVDFALSNTFAFGGLNTSLVLGRWNA